MNKMITMILLALAVSLNGASAGCLPGLLQQQGGQSSANAARGESGSDRPGRATSANSAAGARGAEPISIGADADYRLSPNDVIDIRVEKAEELSGTYRLSATGTFDMPFVGKVAAKGKTSDELARLIADGLRGGYLVNPQVRVVITQYSGRSFFIQGAVHTPGLYQVGGYPTLLELITIAGGLTENHGTSAFIIRKLKPAEAGGEGATKPAAEPSAEAPQIAKYEMLKVNINGLLRGIFDNNIVVEPGDIINIPTSDVFFIAGEVHAPGSFPLKEGTTLRQAISLAQGTTFKAAVSRAIIFREDPATGQRVETKVDIGAIMGGKQEDLLLRANDVILVPNSKMKSVGSIFLSAFGFGSTRFPVPRF